MTEHGSRGVRPHRIVGLAGVALLVLGCSSSGPTASPTEAPTQSAIASTGLVPTTAGPSAAPTSEAPTAAPTEVPGGASPTPKAIVQSLTVPAKANCLSDNGTGTIGYVHISWTATDATGVRLSIDPPSAATAYGAGYADYEAIGSADVPFACDPPNSDAKGHYHLYVVTTTHAPGGYFSYRFAKAYQAP